MQINESNIKKAFKYQLTGSFILLLIAMLLLYGFKEKRSGFNNGSGVSIISIPVGGNSWVTNNLNYTNQIVNEKSISNWNSPYDSITTYFNATSVGIYNLSIRARVISGKSRIIVTVNDKTNICSIENTNYDTVLIGQFEIKSPGYQNIKMVGQFKSGSVFAEITDFIIHTNLGREQISYVTDEFYWGRRGPSTHLNYIIPDKNTQIKWFYNEVKVPEGNDISGSFFMANGFQYGYFGMQVNSKTERRILFSVWSPFHTDKPEEIPEDKRIKLIAKGNSVYTGEFGNEGAGGQSYLKFDWKSGNTYKFLLKGEPTKNNSSIYSAFFFAPEIESWQLIASFERPYTNEYINRAHSFLENFYTETGYISRTVQFNNQWIYNSNNQWLEITQATFSADATARKGARLDYAGGVASNAFYLKNCGFFNNPTRFNTMFERKSTGIKPNIQFDNLPNQ